MFASPNTPARAGFARRTPRGRGTSNAASSAYRKAANGPGGKVYKVRVHIAGLSSTRRLCVRSECRMHSREGSRSAVATGGSDILSAGERERPYTANDPRHRCSKKRVDRVRRAEVAYSAEWADLYRR